MSETPSPLDSDTRDRERGREATTVLSEPGRKVHTKINAGPQTSPADASARGGDPGQAVPHQIGRYVLRRWLGAGGMGSVYEAVDPSLDRPVAIKLLKGSMDEAARLRMEREARALARLSHPNVVQIYEIGAEAGQTFIAMELVRGQTLDVWQRGSSGWRECVRIYLQAGRGLAAAHAEGLVHRDFKPSNCILGDDGRVRVLDFGLARQRELFVSSSTSSIEGEEESALTRSGSIVSDQLTETGMFVGTPAYMPLEQLEGKPVAAAGDQFSFCVSLYEALYGERPYKGRTPGELAAALAEGVDPIPPGRAVVPARLRRLLLRGLDCSSAKRWPSMDELLAALERLVQPRRWRWALGLFGAGLLVAGGGLWQQAQAVGKRCGGAEEQLSGVWDDERRAEVRAALLGTEVSYAETTAQQVQAQLDDYAQGWARMHESTCEATHVRHEQTEEVMALRMACLGSRRLAMREVVDVLALAEADVVERAVELSSSLDALTRCEDVEGLQAEVPPPEDPAAARQVQALRAQLARAHALQVVGRYEQSIEAIDTLAEQAQELEYGPLLAELDHRRGAVLTEQSRNDEAEASLIRSFVRATEHGHDALAAEAAILLVYVIGVQQERYPEGRQWGTVALAFAGRQRDPSVRASALAHIGMVKHYGGATDPGLQDLQDALAIKERVLGPDHIHVAVALAAISNILVRQGRFEQALEYSARAMAIDERAVGAEHPHVAMNLANVGRIQLRLGNTEGALRDLERARELIKAAGDHDSLAAVLGMLAEVRLGQEQWSEAAELLLESATIIEQELGPEHLSLTTVLSNLSLIRYQQERLPEAIALVRRVVRIREATLGTEHALVADATVNLASMLRDQGERAEALHLGQRVLEIYRTVYGPEHSDVGYALFELAQTLEQLQRRAEAREHAEQALALYRKLPEQPGLAESVELVSGWLQEHPVSVDKPAG